ncbi:MAG: YesL family protein [Oscillospiraceae bacterium]|nr:YesL family protein [Oscillospiraceae bacterium]
MKFFSPDSKFAQVMTSVGEMMILNFCWIIGCLPLVTIGASNAAMYTIMGRRLRKEGSGTIVPFFKAWWSNLKMGSLFWVAQLVITASLVLNFFLTLPTAFKVIAGIFLFLVTLVFSLIYPQIARFRNRWFAYLRNSIILVVLRLGWVLLNLIVILLPLILFLLAPMESLQLGFIWIFIGISGLFLVSAEIMQKILQPLEELPAGRKR